MLHAASEACLENRRCYICGPFRNGIGKSVGILNDCRVLIGRTSRAKERAWTGSVFVRVRGGAGQISGNRLRETRENHAT